MRRLGLRMPRDASYFHRARARSSACAPSSRQGQRAVGRQARRMPPTAAIAPPPGRAAGDARATAPGANRIAHGTRPRRPGFAHVHGIALATAHAHGCPRARARRRATRPRSRTPRSSMDVAHFGIRCSHAPAYGPRLTPVRCVGR